MQVSQHPDDRDLICSACGAERPRPMPRCWLCRREVPAIVRPPVRAGLVKSVASHQPTSFSLATLMLTVAVIAVGCGLATWNLGYAITYAILVPLPLAGVAIRELQSRARGRQLTWTERIATYFIGIAIIQALAALLFVAAFAALFIACIAALSRAGGP